MLAVEMLSEPVVVDDTYCSGLSHMEAAGDGNWRLTFYKRQQSIYGGDEFIVVCRLIAPTSAVLDGVKTVMVALGKQCCGAQSYRLTH